MFWFLPRKTFPCFDFSNGRISPAFIFPYQAFPPKSPVPTAVRDLISDILFTYSPHFFCRSNSVIERSYSRSNVRASSVSRTSSFADRSYGTRTNLGTTSTFAIADYTSAVRYVAAWGIPFLHSISFSEEAQCLMGMLATPSTPPSQRVLTRSHMEAAPHDATQ